MWFRFPEGSESISVELQTFTPEFEDDEGNKYFRAPDHFAPRILDLPGFTTAPQPEGAPEDLPKSDPAQATVVGQLGNQVGALRAEIESLRATLAVVTSERNDLKLKLHEAETNLRNVQADLEDERAAASSTKKK